MTPPELESFPHSYRFPHCSFSQPRTYASAIRKKRTVTPIKTRSSILGNLQLTVERKHQREDQKVLVGLDPNYTRRHGRAMKEAAIRSA